MDNALLHARADLAQAVHHLSLANVAINRVLARSEGTGSQYRHAAAARSSMLEALGATHAADAVARGRQDNSVEYLAAKGFEGIA